MAWAHVAWEGKATSKTSSTTLTTANLNITSGNVVVLAVSCDNTGTSAPTITISVPSGETASWTILAHNSPNPNAASGIRGFLCYIKTTQAWSGFGAVITFSAAITAKAVVGAEFSGGSTTARGTGVTANSSVGTPIADLTGSTQPQSGDLVIAMASAEDNAGQGHDADNSNGSWSFDDINSDDVAFTTGGSAVTNASVLIQHKIVTGTADQTYSPICDGDSGAVAIALAPGSAGQSGVGTASFGGTFTASGVPETFGAGAASLGGTFTASGIDRALGVATANLGFTGTANGQIAAPEVFGAGTAAFGGTFTAAGVDRALGAANAALGFTGTASGVDRALGVAAGSFGFTGTAQGIDRALGAGVAAFGFTGSASGTIPGSTVNGSGVAAFGFTGTANGQPRTLGTAAAPFGFTGAASGVDRALGLAQAAFGFTGSAAGIDRALGVGLATFGFTGSASGSSGRVGAGTALFGFTGSAQGQPRTLGTALGTFGFAGAALGVRRGSGVATTLLGFIAQAQGVGTAPSFTFIPPTHEEPIRNGRSPLDHYRLTYAASVLKRNGHFIAIQRPPHELVADLTHGVDYFIGGFEYQVDADTAAALNADGFITT